MNAGVSPSLAPLGFARRAAPCVLAAFLILFLADGLCSVIDDFAGITRLSELRSGVATACFGASLAVFFLSFLTPLLPRRFLYPPIAFSVFCGVVLPHWESAPAWIDKGLDIAQLLLALGILAWAWDGFGPASFSTHIVGRRAFSWRHLLLSGTSFFFLALGLGLLGVTLVALHMARDTDGFMVMHWNRVEMKAGKYVRDDGKEIDLVPMVHIAEGRFYKKVASSLPPCTVVLAEGLTDRSGQFSDQSSLDYNPIAKAIGLSSQTVFGKALKKRHQVKTRNADIDCADLSPATWDVINGEHNDPEAEDRADQEIILFRNAHVLKEAQVALKTANRLVLPWGADHMPGLEKGVLEMGFRRSATYSFDAIHYRVILAKMIEVLWKH